MEKSEKNPVKAALTKLWYRIVFRRMRMFRIAVHEFFGDSNVRTQRITTFNRGVGPYRLVLAILGKLIGKEDRHEKRI